MKKTFTANTLKIIAILTMFIDHIGAAVIERIINSDVFLSDEVSDVLVLIDNGLRGVGRLAFPLFVFMIVEGYTHTSNLKKYLFRLGIFALISEIPFDMAFNNSLVDFSAQNVFFTLAIGLMVIAASDYISQKFVIVEPVENAGGLQTKFNVLNMILYVGLSLAVVLLGMFLSTVLHSDYIFAGVGAIFIMYKLQGYGKEVAFAVAVIFLGVVIGFDELYALVDVLFIAMYNGKKGKQHKYFFYIFYPAHLLLLSAVAALIIHFA